MLKGLSHLPGSYSIVPLSHLILLFNEMNIIGLSICSPAGHIMIVQVSGREYVCESSLKTAIIRISPRLANVFPEDDLD